MFDSEELTGLCLALLGGVSFTFLGGMTLGSGTLRLRNYTDASEAGILGGWLFLLLGLSLLVGSFIVIRDRIKG